MFMRLNRRHMSAARLFAGKAQSTLEYAIIVVVVVAALTAMSVYVQRSVMAGLMEVEKQINNEPK